MADTPSTDSSAQRRRSPPQSPRSRGERRQSILNQARNSIGGSIAGAIVIKDEDLFFLCDGNGQVPRRGNAGLGLYYRDCRFLNGYELRLEGKPGETLVATGHEGYRAVFELTNPDLRMENGRLLSKEELGICWERTIEGTQLRLQDRLILQNYSVGPIEFTLALHFRAEFEPLFVVRGMSASKLGTRHQPRWDDGQLLYGYDGADSIQRQLNIAFQPAPTATRGQEATFHFTLEAHQQQELLVTLSLSESDQTAPSPTHTADHRKVAGVKETSVRNWLDQQTHVHTDDDLLNHVLERSFRDLRTLRSVDKGLQYFAAGVPWYVALFGRDSLISALQMLAFHPGIAADTLRLLASYQGTRQDDWRDEEPGKIMHELRVGELAHTNQVPQTPYYGSIDATPLFLILLARHASWTGDLTLFHELRDHAEQALEWIAKYGDSDGDGFVDYRCKSGHGLSNQGWKDSGDSIMNADGSLAEPPIALVEVQAYVYQARTALAELYLRAGDSDRARQLQTEADQLRQRFQNAYWQDDLEFLALALQKGGKPAAVISSNPGQALWGGIVEPDRARKIMERLLADDMFNGWGIRTLSEREVRFNPIGYHLGTVWPHDNSLIVAGFRHYGFDEAACQVFAGIVQAAGHFHNRRLPEVFAGFSRRHYGVPVHYPVACHPQAWASGSVPFMFAQLLGLQPEAFDQRLRIVRPVLPVSVHHVELRGLRVGSATIDLNFNRQTGGAVEVQVARVSGQLDVQVEARST